MAKGLIICNKCLETVKINTALETLDLEDKGWHFEDNLILCPKCSGSDELNEQQTSDL